jgi:hypothetical protein
MLSLAFPDHIELKKRSKVTGIRFSDITAIRFTQGLPLGAGFLVMSKGNRDHRITVSFERSELILDAIAQANKSLISPADQDKYRRTAIAAAYSLDRLRQKTKSWPFLLFKYLLFPAVISVVFDALLNISSLESRLTVPVFVFTINFALSAVFGGIEHIALTRQLNKYPTHSSPPSENTIKRSIQVAYYCSAFTMYGIALYLCSKFVR